ncbi:cob(I)yrinic acid a,c-diamide adenosyltransferase [Psychromonas sp. Urea-02u-13]|uniref:cob(I)yrinic acid a,c-diamide adenosyltransferase n=1 Tax=Psychromonas sp. Urea-02u-13 TaxID=2058326 RepID=UPI000C31DCCD|nr:cob(I)yrinic acid a,c-diamide adenosyltransferase [Psychromonas sp. Urea-02u-13]PKG40297.1 cob(I)yrinic acid a,c-diamide adenosyltransferase [Psychromonas sp. Urea-02u-13]
MSSDNSQKPEKPTDTDVNQENEALTKEQKKEQNHKKRMQKSKERIDAKIEAAQEERGLFIVITGNGKGKSTSGFGTIARAVGHDLKAAVVQYVKGTWACGERNLLAKAGVEFHVMGTGFTWNTQDQTTDIVAAQKVWKESQRLLADESVDVVMLDELTYMVTYKYIDLEEVISAIKNRPPMQHVIVTGRACHRSLIELADTVSEVQPLKHAFQAGVKAQKGIDW